MKAKPSKRSGEVILEVGRRDEPLLAAAASVPFRIQSILVPVDFSDCSKKALQYAAPLAEQHGAEIALLYVVGTAPFPPGEYSDINYALLERDMRAAAERKLAALKSEIGSRMVTSTLVRTGSPTVEIVEAARSLPADLIVISTHGHSGLKHILLGSVAEAVVRRAPCPVLVVREREHEFLAK